MKKQAATTPALQKDSSKRTVRLVAVLIGIILALGIAEIGLRIGASLSPRLAGLLYLPTLKTEYDSAESTAELLARGYHGYHPFGATRGFVLNSRGLRTHEYSLTKQPGTLRMLAIGDSFTFDSSSVPYAQMWHQVAGRSLQHQLDQPVEVISLSQPAVGPRFELRLWEVEGRQLEADLVVLGFFVGNDFTDESGQPLKHRSFSSLAHASHLWRLLRNSWLRQRSRDETGRTGNLEADQHATGGFELPGYSITYDPEEPTLPESQFLATDADRMLAISGPDAEGFYELCKEAVEVLERFARDVEATGARFVVMAIPAEAQVDPQLRQRLFPSPLPLDLERPQRCLARELAQKKIQMVDLLPLFRQLHREGDVLLYKPRDTHWTDEGNRLAGRVLAAEIVQRGLLESAN